MSALPNPDAPICKGCGKPMASSGMIWRCASCRKSINKPGALEYWREQREQRRRKPHNSRRAVPDVSGMPEAPVLDRTGGYKLPNIDSVVKITEHDGKYWLIINGGRELNATEIEAGLYMLLKEALHD